MSRIDNPGTIRIETARLILRPPALEDLQDWVHFAAHEETMRHLGGVQSPSNAWRSLMTMIGSWAAHGYGMFSVIEKSSGKWMGRIGPWQPLDWPGAEVGWGLHADYWHQGYALEASAASIDWAFEKLKWPEVIHNIAAENIASIGLAEKLGSTYQRQAVLPAPMNLEVGVWQQNRQQWLANRNRFGL
jgi:RimJ/RimL family protein N-acetyltransferase